MKKIELPDWQTFLADAEKTGALISVPSRKTKESWHTTLQIIQIYGRTPLTLTDMAEIYSPRLSRAAISARFRIGVKIVHGRLPEEIQGKYPLGELLKSKPEPLSKRVARSIEANGLAGAVVKHMGETGGDVDQAVKALGGVSPRRKAVVRSRLREWGLLEKPSLAGNHDLVSKLRDHGIPLAEKRLLLPDVDHHVLQANRGGDDPLFVSAKKLAERVGLVCGPRSARMREVVKVLKGASLLGSAPHRAKGRTVYYHFALAEDPEPLRVLAERFPEAQALILS